MSIWAGSCPLAAYKTAATLLVQNLRKGNRHLLELLEQESAQAFDDRKRQAKILGERSGDKTSVSPRFFSLESLCVIDSVRAGCPWATEKLPEGGVNIGELRAFWEEEDAVGVVEIILILVVLVGLVIIFKKQLVSLVNSLLSKITSQSNGI